MPILSALIPNIFMFCNAGNRCLIVTSEAFVIPKQNEILRFLIVVDAAVENVMLLDSCQQDKLNKDEFFRRLDIVSSPSFGQQSTFNISNDQGSCIELSVSLRHLVIRNQLILDEQMLMLLRDGRNANVSGRMDDYQLSNYDEEKGIKDDTEIFSPSSMGSSSSTNDYRCVQLVILTELKRQIGYYLFQLRLLLLFTIGDTIIFKGPISSLQSVTVKFFKYFSPQTIGDTRGQQEMNNYSNNGEKCVIISNPPSDRIPQSMCKLVNNGAGDVSQYVKNLRELKLIRISDFIFVRQGERSLSALDQLDDQSINDLYYIIDYCDESENFSIGIFRALGNDKEVIFGASNLINPWNCVHPSIFIVTKTVIDRIFKYQYPSLQIEQKQFQYSYNEKEIGKIIGEVF
ncbi:MAG: hypothetical protein EZS28_023689 [Streblomastix strix]|uniref:Uncharacterized protein n=1 Tax=Streblomastix strix TaxID=222440 RepID=A0A5J4VEH0_9EUKA|nr:MAG: hypothetical protein EZS28_023689 [Streblomastix strix]